MSRASDAQKAERLNRARVLLRQVDQLSDAVERLAQDCSFAASSLPLSRTSSAAEGACSARRGQTGIYGQASTQPDSAGPGVRYDETIVHQRGGQPGVARAAAARPRAWVSRSQVGHGPVGWSIDLIVCWRTSWRKRTSCWCRTNGGQSAESEKEPLNQQNPSRR
jgi:hypothetical protein